MIPNFLIKSIQTILDWEESVSLRGVAFAEDD
jgi:hypothetical protein